MSACQLTSPCVAYDCHHPVTEARGVDAGCSCIVQSVAPNFLLAESDAKVFYHL